MPFLNVLLYEYPAHFIRNLSNCDKTAYLDTNENIDAILPYINDVSENTFIKGVENGFLTTHYGFSESAFRNNYFLAKLKIMISSGIQGYWKTWFRNSKTKSKQLFQHYANWTGSTRSHKPQKLNFSSKIIMGFYIYGILSTACLLVFAIEVTYVCGNKHIGNLCHVLVYFLIKSSSGVKKLMKSLIFSVILF